MAFFLREDNPMQKKSVLFINGHLNAGGCERSLIDLLRHLDYSSYQVDLLLLEGLGDYYDELPPEVHVHLYSLEHAFGPFWKCMTDAWKNKDLFSFGFRLAYCLSSLFGRRMLRLSRGLFSECAGKYDAIVAYRQGICTDLAAYAFSGERKISWWHYGEFRFSSKQTIMIEKAFRNFDNLVTVSEICAHMIREHIPSVDEKIRVIPNILDSDELFRKASSYEPPSKGSGVVKIVSVGRLSPEKNFLLCVDAAEELLRAGMQFTWSIIGDGAEFKEIQERIIKYGLEKHIVLLGRRTNPYPWILSADMLVHPSLVESQGLSILEAMALNTPVICVKSAGPMEYIVDGENGFLVEASPAMIADRIMWISNHPDLRIRVAQLAKQTVMKFSAGRVVHEFTQVING